MNTICHSLRVLLYITQDTLPGTHTPITTTLPTPVLSWCSIVDKVATVKEHTHTHTHTPWQALQSPHNWVQILRLWTVYQMAHLLHPVLPIPPVSSPFSIPLHTLTNLSTVQQTVNGLCKHVLCLHGPHICCVAMVRFVGCHSNFQ